MGIVVRLPVRRHARASSITLKPKTRGDADRPFAARKFRKISALSLAILPRAFQLLTAGSPTPANDAAAVTPPTASITESTVSNMAGICSRRVNKSSLHNSVMDCSRFVSFNRRMVESVKSLGNRLKTTREALGISAAELCKTIQVRPNPGGLNTRTASAESPLRSPISFATSSAFPWIGSIGRTRHSFPMRYA